MLNYNLIECLENKGIKQKELAKMANVHEVTISRAVNGFQLKERTWWKLAKALDVTVGDIFVNPS